MQPCIIVDQNALRGGEVIRAALERAGPETLIVLVDVLLAEMSKKDPSGGMLRRNLAFLSTIPDRVVVTRSAGTLVVNECATGRPTTSIVDDDNTGWFRQVLRDLRRGDGRELGTLLASLADAMEHVRPILFDDARNRATVAAVTTALRDELSEADRKALRKNPRDEMVRHLTSPSVTPTLMALLSSRGSFDPANITRVAGSRSIARARFLALSGLGLYWNAFGGLDRALPETATNDLIDHDVITFAARCDALLTNDKATRAISDAVREAMASPTVE